ncbi:MAG: hypothetical protein RR768_09910 [Clostridium sp.]
MSKKQELLEKLTELTECSYISDLHNPAVYEKVKQVIDHINIGDYSSKEWQEAFFYVTGTEIQEGTEEDIRKMIKNSK